MSPYIKDRLKLLSIGCFMGVTFFVMKFAPEIENAKTRNTVESITYLIVLGFLGYVVLANILGWNDFFRDTHRAARNINSTVEGELDALRRENVELKAALKEREGR